MNEIVAQSYLFRSLDEQARGDLLSLGYVRRFPAGTTIVEEGQLGAEMFLLIEGSVRVETDSPAGKVELATLGVGACIGEVSLLTGRPRTATVIATSTVDAAVFEKHRIDRFLDEHPKMRNVLEGLIQARARDTIEKIIG